MGPLGPRHQSSSHDKIIHHTFILVIQLKVYATNLKCIHPTPSSITTDQSKRVGSDEFGLIPSITGQIGYELETY